MNGKKGKIEEFLKSQAQISKSSIKSFDDLLKFVPGNSRWMFLINLKENLDNNNNLINMLANNCKKLNAIVPRSGSNCAPLWIYALGKSLRLI